MLDQKMKLYLNWKIFELELSHEEISVIEGAVILSEKEYQKNKKLWSRNNPKEDESYTSSVDFWSAFKKQTQVDCTVQDISNGIRALTNKIGWATSSWSDSGPHGIDFDECEKMNIIKKKLCAFLISFFQTQHDLDYVGKSKDLT